MRVGRAPKEPPAAHADLQGVAEREMRFHCGPTPEDDGFAPEAEGWLSIREPKPLALQLMALPVAFGVLLLCGALLYLVFPRELLTKPAVIPVPFWPLLAILVLFAPVHGCLHALALLAAKCRVSCRWTRRC